MHVPDPEIPHRYSDDGLLREREEVTKGGDNVEGAGKLAVRCLS